MDAMISLEAAVAAAPVKSLCITPSCMAKEAAGAAYRELVRMFGEACIAILKFLSTFWMQVPSPTVAVSGSGGWSTVSTIGQMQAWLGPFTAIIAIGSYSIAIGRIGFSGRGEDARKVVRQIAAVGAGTLVITAGTQILITAGDQFSPWIIQQASSERDPSKGLETLIVTGFGSGQPTQNIGLWLVVFLLSVLGAIAQCFFMIARGAALMVLMVFVAPVTAGAASDEGWHRLKRFAMLIIGFALYKPVAAIIYATGISMMTKPESGGPVAGGGDVKGALYGLAIMILAAVALPAFIKFLMPIAAMGSSNMFSGAAVAGVVAAGAAIVATGGAGAAAGAGSAGAGSAGAGSAGASGAGSAGAAGTPGAGSAGPAGAGGSPGSPGSGGGSGSPGGAGSPGAAGSAPEPGSSGSTQSGGGREFAHAMAGSANSAASTVNQNEVEDER